MKKAAGKKNSDGGGAHAAGKKNPRGSRANVLIFQFVVCALLLAALAMAVDLNSLAMAFSKIKIEYFLLASAAYFAINLLMSFRLTLLLSDMKEKIPFLSALRAHYFGMFSSDFTPARAGYFGAAFSLNSRGVPLSKAISAILAPQLFDFFVKVFSTVVAAAYIASMFGMSGSALLPIAAAVAVILSFMALIALLVFYPSISSPYLPLLKKIPFGGKLFLLCSKLQENAPVMRKNLPMILSIMAATWALKGFEWWMLWNAAGINAQLPANPFLFFFILQPAVTLLQFIPAPTPAGAGVSEAGTVGILLLFGVPAAPALVFGLLTRFVMIAQDWVGIFDGTKLSLDFLDEEKW